MTAAGSVKNVTAMTKLAKWLRISQRQICTLDRNPNGYEAWWSQGESNP
jgi:hypothetical protein